MELQYLHAAFPQDAPDHVFTLIHNDAYRRNKCRQFCYDVAGIPRLNKPGAFRIKYKSHSICTRFCRCHGIFQVCYPTDLDLDHRTSDSFLLEMPAINAGAVSLPNNLGNCRLPYQFSYLLTPVLRCHNRLTHQDGVDANVYQPLDILPAIYPALTDDHLSPGNLPDNPEGGLYIHLKGGQVPVIDANDPCIGHQRLFNLSLIMDLNQT